MRERAATAGRDVLINQIQTAFGQLKINVMSTQDQENEKERGAQSTTGAQPGLDQNHASKKDKDASGNYQGSEGGSAEAFDKEGNAGRFNTAEGRLNSNISERAHAERPKIDSADPQTTPDEA